MWLLWGGRATHTVERVIYLCACSGFVLLAQPYGVSGRVLSGMPVSKEGHVLVPDREQASSHPPRKGNPELLLLLLHSGVELSSCGILGAVLVVASLVSSSLAYILGWALGLGSRRAVLVGPTIPIFKDVEREKGQLSVLVEAHFLSAVLA